MFNSVLTSGCLKDHKDFSTWRGFASLLPNQQRLVPLWARIFGEVRCPRPPTCIQKCFQDAESAGGQSSPAIRSQLQQHPFSSTGQGLPGREGGRSMLDIKWTSHTSTPAIAGIRAHCYWPCSFPWVSWQWVAWRWVFFLLIMVIFFHRAL